MPAVTRQDWSRAEVPRPFTAHSDSFERLALIGPHTGSVHTDLGVGRLQPGGSTDLHVHSYEEAIYVLEGELAVQINDRAHLLVPGDYAFFPIGSLHGFRNPGGTQARWMDVNSPVALREASGRRDTFFPRDPVQLLHKALPP
ncbi:MAG: hypothetical protein QOF44_974, partial [Streptomyces sp.]|nr:hypothetical protein [Streptomyces sp.]